MLYAYRKVTSKFVNLGTDEKGQADLKSAITDLLNKS